MSSIQTNTLHISITMIQSGTILISFKKTQRRPRKQRLHPPRDWSLRHQRKDRSKIRSIPHPSPTLIPTKEEEHQLNLKEIRNQPIATPTRSKRLIKSWTSTTRPKPSSIKMSKAMSNLKKKTLILRSSTLNCMSPWKKSRDSRKHMRRKEQPWNISRHQWSLMMNNEKYLIESRFKQNRKH